MAIREVFMAKYREKAILLASYLPFIFICTTIFILSNMSRPPIPETLSFTHSDKLLHFIAFFAVGIASSFAVSAREKSISLTIIIESFIMGALYAAFDEIHQAYVPQRDASFFDFLADAMGVLTANIVYYKSYLKISSYLMNK